jgi:transcription initiation factor TFIIH subunit 4
LEEYSTQSWESVLHYLVGTPNQKSDAVVKLLLRLGLMQKRYFILEFLKKISDSQDDLRITNKGFQFLLQDVQVQIWAFLQQYLDMAGVIFLNNE